jgi:hypothetical protein
MSFAALSVPHGDPLLIDELLQAFHRLMLMLLSGVRIWASIGWFPQASFPRRIRKDARVASG